MTYLSALQKLEIYFWTTLVRMMKSHNAVRLTWAVLTLAILGGAIVIGSRVKYPHSADLAASDVQKFVPRDNESLSATAQPVEYIHRQENYLIIFVDSLIAQQPALEGVWLAGSASSVPQIVLLPLYPSYRDAEAGKYSSLFEIDSDGKPASFFLDFLRSKNIWWDHYLMVDRASLADFIEVAGIVGLDGRVWSGAELVASLPKTNQAPEAALKVQAQIASELCQSVSGLIEDSSPEILWGLLTHDMRSDLTLEKVASIQAVFRLSGGTPACDFPTLQVMTSLIGTE